MKRQAIEFAFLVQRMRMKLMRLIDNGKDMKIQELQDPEESQHAALLKSCESIDDQ
jgi:hypothetical protein